MKTGLLATMAMAALLAAGCSQNEMTEISPDVRPAVGFNVYATAQARGTETTNTTIQNSSSTGFGVLAYYTGQSDMGTSSTPNFMWNQQVEYVAPKWEYTPVKYWPNTEGDKISFFAYAPYSETQTGKGDNGILLTTATTAGYPKIDFSVNETASSQVDLVATNAAQNSVGTDKTINLEKTTGNVPFKFKHVLTRLDFCAKLAADVSVTTAETKIFVKSIKLLGSGADSPAASNSNSKFYSKATYKFQDGKWDYASATVQTTPITLDDLLFAGVTQSFGSYTTKSVAVASTSSTTPLFKSNQSLFLIPPTNAGIASANDMRVLLTYDVVTIDAKLSGGKSVIETKAVVSLPNGTMMAGTAYKYVFTIGLESVKVTADVVAWPGYTDVAVPSADASDATATKVNDALTTLNGFKAVDNNCNYFVVNVTGAPTTTVALGGTTTNFVTGDRIELKCTSSPTGTYSLSGWTAAKSGTSIILTKN